MTMTAVVASQRAGAKRRPMTGSAKQSRFACTCARVAAGLLRRPPGSSQRPLFGGLQGWLDLFWRNPECRRTLEQEIQPCATRCPPDAECADHAGCGDNQRNDADILDHMRFEKQCACNGH